MEPLLADAEIYIVSHSTDADAQVIIAGGDEEGITELFIMPRCIESYPLLKRWLLGIYQGAVRSDQLDY